jgi:quercetin dioxygenase-like cupin family protein
MKAAMIVVAVLVVGVAGWTRAGDKGGSAKSEAVTIPAAEVKFGPAPPVLPAGAQLAVLHGDPGKKGPYAIRLKMPDGYKIAPHWHTNEEELTIISGTLQLAMGDKAGENVHTLTAGGFHFLPAKMHHSASAKGETQVEVHAMGPFDIHYLNPADDPTKKSAANQ